MGMTASWAAAAWGQTPDPGPVGCTLLPPTSVRVGERFDFTAFKLNRTAVPMTGVRYVFEVARQSGPTLELAGPGPERGIIMPCGEVDAFDSSLGLVDSPAGTAQLMMLRPLARRVGDPSELLWPGASVAIPLTGWRAVRPGLAIIWLTVFSNEFSAVRREIAAVVVTG